MLVLHSGSAYDVRSGYAKRAAVPAVESSVGGGANRYDMAFVETFSELYKLRD